MISSTIQRACRLFSASALAACAAIALSISASATVRYVDLNSASPTPPFTNWAAAAMSIQDAVDAADPGDEIVVTNGVYQTGGRVVSGAMTNRVAVTKPVTVRSVNGPAVTTIQGNSPIGDSAVRCAYLANGSSLVGFTLTSGATGLSVDQNQGGSGGGVWCESASAVVSNCVLSGNSAAYGGGGAHGGTLNNCRLSGNSAIWGGGAYNSTLNNCTLIGNSASEHGGGAYADFTTPCTLNNCTLTGNSASMGGGALTAIDSPTALTLNNCILTGNSGRGVYSGTLNNCIVYYNTGGNYYYGNFSYCCTTPLPASGTGNFTNAPMFVDLADGDLRLQVNSPCINAGNNAYAVGTTDLAGRPRIVGRTVDVGAYEFQGPYLNVAATTGGSVIRDPDQPDYPLGSLVTVTATPTVGYGFIRWTGDATGSTNPLTVIMDTNKSIVAVFASTALTLASQGVGTITKVPDQPFYPVAQQVTLSATAGRWHEFSGWTDANTSNPRLVTVGESNAYTAVFTPTTPLDTVIIGGVSRLAPVGMPAVVLDGVFILTPTASARGSATVTLGTTFPGGWLFYTLDGSDPAVSGALYTGQLTVPQAGLLRAIAYNADFTQSMTGDPLTIDLLPTLTALTDGGGSVAIEPPSGAYFSNALALATANATPGWTFLHWLGDTVGTSPAVSVSMTRNKTVRAVFGTTLNTTVVGSGSIVANTVSPWHPY
ncbi:MAG: chitobiase/beta-hexosaminidase C-terminal domain-containing protein, partial [Verrucomicrobia bacterium]|nr:chitobiase/beta-hexosaminidase C-terminal domain-containing protein [Verrucomicrobiota bacterium]